MTGTIPPELGSCTNLTYVRLSGNALTGQVPATLASAPGLRFLYLHDNALTGSIPPQFSTFRQLERFLIYVSHCLLAFWAAR